jgi:hypothetical protein
MTLQDRRHAKRADAGQHLKDLLQEEITGLDGLRSRDLRPGWLGGFLSVPPSSAPWARREPRSPSTASPAPPSSYQPESCGPPTRRAWSPGWRTACSASKPARPRPSPASSAPAARSPTPATAWASRSPRRPSLPKPASAADRSTSSSPRSWPSARRRTARRPRTPGRSQAGRSRRQGHRSGPPECTPRPRNRPGRRRRLLAGATR